MVGLIISEAVLETLQNKSKHSFFHSLRSSCRDADREKGRASWCQVGLPAQSLPRCRDADREKGRAVVMRTNL